MTDRRFLKLQERARIGLVLVVGILLATCSVAQAQLLQPVLDDQAVETTNVEIQKIYHLTEVARNAVDFERIVERSERLLNQVLTPKDEKYLRSLVAWSRNRLAQKHLQNAISMSELGLQRQSDEQLDLAIKQFDIVIAASPLTWRAWMGRARIHAMAGEYELALEKFIEVTKRKRSQTQAWFNAAEISLHLKRFEQAIDFYSRLIKEDPTDVQSLTGRAHARLASEEYPAAIADYSTVAKLLPKNEIALCNLGDAYVTVEMWHEAFEQFEAAAQLETAQLGRERLAELLLNGDDDTVRDIPRAIQLTNQWIQEKGDSEALLRILATAYQKSGQIGLADEVLGRVEKLPQRQARATTNTK